MIYYLVLALIKVFDNIISTAKNITTYKEQKVLSSILVVVSQLIFYLVISQVISDSTVLTIVIVSISSGIGNYIAFLINDKFKKDSKWTMVITSTDCDDLKSLCNYLSSKKIRYVASNGYDREWNPTINIIAFSKTKEESRLIKNFLHNNNISHILEII